MQPANAGKITITNPGMSARNTAYEAGTQLRLTAVKRASREARFRSPLSDIHRRSTTV